MPIENRTAPQGAGRGAGPATEQAPTRGQEQKPEDLVLRYGSITRECRDTIYRAWPKDCLLARSSGKVVLRIRHGACDVYAQYSNRGRLKWAVLRVYFEKDGALWKAEWRYDDYDDIYYISEMAREAWNILKHAGVAAKEALILWLKQPGGSEIIKALEL